MKEMIANILVNFVSVDFISQLIASGISKILASASKKKGKAWDKSKKIIKSIEQWCHLFNECYEDDELTEEEEAKIAEAIKNLTATKKIATILKSK